MESGSTVTASSTRKGKLPKRQKANEDKDIISKLPETLISRILSLLPTEDAVRTSILSKRWLYHWTSITKLDIKDSVFYSLTDEKQYFVNFLNRVLLLTKASSTESFSLVLVNKYDVSLVNTWISSILNRHLKNLHIDSRFELPFSALTSRSLFNSCLLEELVLNMCTCAIKVPTVCVYFGHLKLLKLSGITFAIDSSSDNPSLILPVLKRFETRNCIWISAKDVSLKAPLLESVFIQQEPKSISHEPCSCAIRISALNLTDFTYRGFGMSPFIILSDPSSVQNASADIILYLYIDGFEEMGSRAIQLLKQFSQVKSLKYDWSGVLVFSKVADLPVFGMLSHLELGSVAGEVLLCLIYKSPVLNTLVFKGIYKFDQEKLKSATVPDCLTSTLKAVKFGRVHGHNHELCLAKFMIENGLVLERMSFSVFCHPQGKSKVKVMEEFKEKLFSFKKGFSFAIFEFTYNY